MSFTGFSDDIAAGTIIANSAFWPDMDLAIFQQSYRLPGEYREQMLTDRVKLAMIWANGQLAGWQSEQQALGAATLSEVQGDLLGSESTLTLLYVRAVSCHAKALLLADYATMLRKADDQRDAKESDDTADKWHQFANDAVSSIKGQLKIHAEAL